MSLYLIERIWEVADQFIEQEGSKKRFLRDATCDFKNPGACVISSDELSSIVEIVNQNFEEASAHTNLT